MNVEYINGFSCAINEDRNELVINFLRTMPKTNEEGDFEDGVEASRICTIIMNSDNAMNLKNSIENLISNVNESKD